MSKKLTIYEQLGQAIAGRKGLSKKAMGNLASALDEDPKALEKVCDALADVIDVRHPKMSLDLYGDTSATQVSYDRIRGLYRKK